MQRVPFHTTSPLPDDEESQVLNAKSIHNLCHSAVQSLTNSSPILTDKTKPSLSNGQKQVVECSTKFLFILSLSSLLAMLALTILSTSSSSSKNSKLSVNVIHGEYISVDESFAAKSRVFPITYLDVDFSNAENLKLNRVRGICKIYLSTYFMFNYDAKRASYNPPTVIGADGVVETPYTHWKKIERTLQFLNGEESNYIGDYDIIVFSDSTDVFFINNIEEIRNVYENYYVKEISKIDMIADAEKDWPLVFIAEKNKWPPNDYIQNMFDKTPEELDLVQKHYYNKDGYHVYNNCDRSTQRIYLNSGLYVGRKRDIRKALTIGINLKRSEPKERLGDQAVYQYIYTTKKYPILMDCEYKMFFSPFSVCNTVSNNPTSKWSCAINENNKQTPNTVVALHSNGGFCPSLCNCFNSMKQKNTFKNMLSQFKDSMSFKSYDINTRKVKNVLMDYACGRFVDEDYPEKACNVQPPKANPFSK